jgi:hypothetical protein
MVCEVVDCQLAQDNTDRRRATVTMVTKLLTPHKAINFLTCSATISYSRRIMFYGVSSGLNDREQQL